MKALNFTVQPMGRVTNTVLKVKNWQDLYEFRVVAMDDFDIKLGIDFFVKAQVVVMPYMGKIMVSNATNLDFVRYTLVSRDSVVKRNYRNQFISLLQLKVRVKKCEHTYVAALIETKLD